MMSFDWSENAMLGSLEKGAYFYFTKPLYMEDMSDIWQYVHTRRHQQQRQRSKLRIRRPMVFRNHHSMKKRKCMKMKVVL